MSCFGTDDRHTSRATYSRDAVMVAQKVLKIDRYVVAGEGTVRIAGN